MDEKGEPERVKVSRQSERVMHRLLLRLVLLAPINSPRQVGSTLLSTRTSKVPTVLQLLKEGTT